MTSYRPLLYKSCLVSTFQYSIATLKGRIYDLQINEVVNLVETSQYSQNEDSKYDKKCFYVSASTVLI